MFQNDRKRIPGVQEAPKKFGRGKGDCEKAGKSALFSCNGGNQQGRHQEQTDSQKDREPGFGRRFPYQIYQKYAEKQNKDRPAAGERDPRKKNDQPRETAETDRSAKQKQDDSKEKINRVSIRVLEKPGLPPGNQKPPLERHNSAQEEGQDHHDRGRIGNPVQEIHALIRLKLLHQENEQWERQKLNSADERHAAIRAPKHSTEMKQNDGGRG